MDIKQDQNIVPDDPAGIDNAAHSSCRRRVPEDSVHKMNQFTSKI